MQPAKDQVPFEMEGENSDETNNTFLKPTISSNDEQITTKSLNSDTTNITQAISMKMVDLNANHSTDDDDETTYLNDNHYNQSQNVTATDDDNNESKEDDNADSNQQDIELTQLPPIFTGPMMRQLSAPTMTIVAFFQIMGRIYIHNDDMFHKSCQHQISHDENDNSPRLVEYSKLPQWHDVNAWIVNGYRQSYTTRDCVKSIIQKHNECGNIWTEFIPGFALIIFFIYHLLYNPSWILYLFPQNDANCKLLLFRYSIFYWINFLMILIRPFISGCAHWFHPINRKCYNRWWKADYISIVWSTMASASNFAICEFFCNFVAFGAIEFCLFAISSILTVFIVGSSVNSNMGSKQFALLLMLGFEYWGSFIWSSSILIHSARTNNEVWMNDDHFRYYLYWLISVIFSWIAAVFRVTQLPERCIFKSALKKIIENAGESWTEYKRIMRKAHCEREKVRNNKQLKKKLQKYAEYSKEAMQKDHFFYYYFTSHQFWHIFVNLSVLFQMLAWIQYFIYRNSLNNPCC